MFDPSLPHWTNNRGGERSLEPFLASPSIIGGSQRGICLPTPDFFFSDPCHSAVFSFYSRFGGEGGRGLLRGEFRRERRRGRKGEPCAECGKWSPLSSPSFLASPFLCHWRGKVEGRGGIGRNHGHICLKSVVDCKVISAHIPSQII